jgi:hypothetical protein
VKLPPKWVRMERREIPMAIPADLEIAEVFGR